MVWGMDQLAGSEIVSELHAARGSWLSRFLRYLFAVEWPVLSHFDHGHNEQHIESDADVDDIGLNASGFLEGLVLLRRIGPRTFLELPNLLAAVPVVHIICRGSGHDAPDETHGDIAG